MDEMLEKCDNATLSVDTRFAGTRSNACICGGISGLTTENFTSPQLTRGVLEGMANALFEMYTVMDTPKCGIIGSGNGVRKNPALIGVFEKLFNAKMAFPRHLEEASFGAALFGLISCGVCKNAAEAQKLIKYC